MTTESDKPKPEPTVKKLADMSAAEVVALADAELLVHRQRQKYLRALARTLETQ